MIGCESELASLCHRNYTLAETGKAWALSVGAIQNESRTLRLHIEQQKAEIAQLRRKVENLKRRIAG
jgi:cell division protein FtsB